MTGQAFLSSWNYSYRTSASPYGRRGAVSLSERVILLMGQLKPELDWYTVQLSDRFADRDTQSYVWMARPEKSSKNRRYHVPEQTELYMTCLASWFARIAVFELQNRAEESG
jgi:hypothetical protein